MCSVDKSARVLRPMLGVHDELLLRDSVVPAAGAVLAGAAVARSHEVVQLAEENRMV